MELREIQELLKKYQGKQELIWDGKNLPGIPIAGIVQEDVFGGESICFGGLSLEGDFTGFTGSISGVAVAGVKSPPCRMTVHFYEEEQGGQLACELKAEAEDNWIPFSKSRTGITVSAMEYAWYVSEKSRHTDCRGAIEMTYGTIPLSGTYDIYGSQKTVRIGCKNDTGTYPLEEIFFGDEGTQYIAMLPEGLRGLLDALQIKTATFQWNTGEDFLELFNVKIGIADGKMWEVMEGLSLGDFSVSMKVTGGGQGEKQVTWGIHGKMEIGKGELPLSVYYRTGDEGFFVQTGSTDTKVTGLDFLTPFCGNIPVDKLPVVAAMDQVFFKFLYFTWDASQNRISSFEVQAGLDISLNVADLFSVEEMKFTYSKSGEDSSLILGGRFSLAGVPFAIDAKDSDGWLVQAYTLGPDEVSLSALMQSLLKKCGAPEVPLPSIGLDNIFCSYDMKKQAVSFSALTHVGKGGENENTVSFQSIAASVEIKMQKENGGWQYEVSVSGEAKLLDSVFDISYRLDAEEKINTFELIWKPQEDFSLDKLLSGLGLGEVEIPEGILPIPDEMKMDYDFSNKALKLEAASGEKKLLFGSEEDASGDRGYHLALRLGIQIALDGLPLAGSQVKELGENKITVIFLLNTKPMKNFSAGDIVRGITADAGMYFHVQMGEESYLFPLTKFKQNRLLCDLGQNVEQSAGNKEGAGWELQKKIGPFLLQRLLLSCREKKVWIGMDASLESGLLQMDLYGAELGIPFSKEEPAFSLAGFGLSVTSPAIRFGGEFRKKDENTYQGEIEAGVSDIMVELAGEFSRKPYPSAFVVGEMTGREVGPPCFSVNMIQGAFGYNRRISIPSIEGLEDFVLIRLARGKISQSELLANADSYFPVQKDTDFVAAGIRARTFEVLEVFAVLAVMFGAELEFDLLGRAALEYPKKDKNPIVSGALLVKMTIRPGSGVIPVDGKISEDSYILNKNCHLKGGFAFYIWYGGEHKGDFVISVGGYADRFQRPSHYPALEPLGFEWKLTSHLSASGSIYFALTPAAIMAGGGFEMVFHEGCVEAWVRAVVAILFGWKPYCYDLLVDISIGVKVHLGFFHLKVELGCGLHIWGPEFSGIARVKLWIISFSIPFRSDQGEEPTEGVEGATISVAEFRESFLPEPDKNADDAGTEVFGSCNCEISSSGTLFRAVVKAPLPFSKVYWQKNLLEGDGDAKVYLRPCDKEVEPELYAELVRTDRNPMESVIKVSVTKEKLPAALWGKKNSSESLSEEAIGLEIAACEEEGYTILGQIGENTGEKSFQKAQANQLSDTDYHNRDVWEEMKKIGSEGVSKNRSLLLQGLSSERFVISLEGFSGSKIFSSESELKDMGGGELYGR